MGHTRFAPWLMVLLAGAARSAAAEDPPEALSAVEEAAELNPPLPGRVKGERPRPVVADTTAKVEAKAPVEA